MSDRMNGAALGRWVAWSARRAPAIAALSVATMLGSALFAAGHLRVNSDPDILFASDLPFRKNAAAFEAAFPALRRQLVVLVEAESPAAAHRGVSRLASELERRDDLFARVYVPGGGDFFDRQGLLFLARADLEALADRLVGAQPFLAELAREPTLPHLLDLLTQAVEGADPGAESEEFAETLRLVALQLAPDRGEGSPSWERWALGGGLDLSHDLRVLYAEPRPTFDRMVPTDEALAAVQVASRALGLDEARVRVRVTGDLALATEEQRGLREQGALLAALSFLGVSLILCIALGFRQAVAALLSLATGLFATAALAAASFDALNLLSVTFAVLFIGLGIDFAIHFASHLPGREESEGDLVAALAASAERVGPALCLCAVTTAVAFFSFTPTDYRGIAELGWIAGCGMILSLLVTLVVQPAWMVCLGAWGHAPRSFESRPSPRRVPLIRARHLALGLLVLTLAAIPSLRTLRFESDPLSVRDPRMPSVAAFRELIERGSLSPWTAELVEASPAAAEARAQTLRNSDAIGEVLTLASFVPVDQEAKLAIVQDLSFLLGDLTPQPAPPVDPTRAQEAFLALRVALDRWLETGGESALANAVRELRDATEERLARFDLSIDDYDDVARLQARVIGDLPEWLSRLSTSLEASAFTVEDLPEALRARFLTSDGRARVQVFARGSLSDVGETERFADAVQRVAPHASGSAIRIVEASRAVTRALRAAFLVAVVAIAMLLALLWRRLLPVAGLLVILLLISLWTGALSQWLGIPINFANVVVLPLLLGIGVDSGIHLIDPRGAEPAHRRRAARAVLLSALTTVASFAVLAFSPHAGLASLGRLLLVGIFWILVANLVALPLLREALARALKRH